MAVRTARLTAVTRKVTPSRVATIKYVRDGQVWEATKLDPAEFDEAHRQVLKTAYFVHERKLAFAAPGWNSSWIGGGEEKIVFLIIDPQQRAFALEVLAKNTYLHGHLAEGHYFADLYVPHLVNTRWDQHSLCGHVFSGHLKAREFIYGETIAGPCASEPPVVSVDPFRRLIGYLSKKWAISVVLSRYHRLRRIYRDAHEANVMIEVLPLNNPEKKDHYLFPIPWLEDDGRLHLRFYRLTPIDVRAR